MEIEEHISLAPQTTFHMGGEARFFLRAKTLEEVAEGCRFAKEKAAPLFILGGGSNILVGEGGFDGLVIKMEVEGVTVDGEGEQAVFTAGSGESWDALVARTVSDNCWGIENLSGIPGTVGGAVVQNVGAYGQALSQTCLWVEVFDRERGEVQTLSSSECLFGYRDSVFKKNEGSVIVLRAAFALSKVPAPDLSYKDLAKLSESTMPTLAAIRKAVLSIRKNKFPDLSVEGTAGSFFKNPILLPEEAKSLRERYPDMPVFTLPEAAGVKIPLAYLLDRGLGLSNYALGGARLFERQPLVIAAARGTSAREVMALARVVAQKINDAYGIAIEPEVKILSGHWK